VEVAAGDLIVHRAPNVGRTRDHDALAVVTHGDVGLTIGGMVGGFVERRVRHNGEELRRIVGGDPVARDPLVAELVQLILTERVRDVQERVVRVSHTRPARTGGVIVELQLGEEPERGFIVVECIALGEAGAAAPAREVGQLEVLMVVWQELCSRWRRRVDLQEVGDGNPAVLIGVYDAHSTAVIHEDRAAGVDESA